MDKTLGNSHEPPYSRIVPNLSNGNDVATYLQDERKKMYSSVL